MPWLNNSYNNSTASEKTSLVICNIKGPDQPGHLRSLISNFVVCFLRRIIPRHASCEIISIFYLACLAEGTGLLETQKTGFLASWPVLLARQLWTNISSATDNNIKNKYNEEAVHQIY